MNTEASYLSAERMLGRSIESPEASLKSWGE